jgi:hypothetical protein
MTAAAIAAARKRKQTTSETCFPGAIVLNGTTYAGGNLFLSKIEHYPKPDGSGWAKRQTISITIRKSLLATAPQKREKFTCAGHSWTVDTVGGQTADALAWIIKGERFPNS